MIVGAGRRPPPTSHDTHSLMPRCVECTPAHAPTILCVRPTEQLAQLAADGENAPVSAAPAS